MDRSHGTHLSTEDTMRSLPPSQGYRIVDVGEAVDGRQLNLFSGV